jgi:hypothetical protein
MCQISSAASATRAWKCRSVSPQLWKSRYRSYGPRPRGNRNAPSSAAQLDAEDRAERGSARHSLGRVDRCRRGPGNAYCVLFFTLGAGYSHGRCPSGGQRASCREWTADRRGLADVLGVVGAVGALVRLLTDGGADGVGHQQGARRARCGRTTPHGKSGRARQPEVGQADAKDGIRAPGQRLSCRRAIKRAMGTMPDPADSVASTRPRTS